MLLIQLTVPEGKIDMMKLAADILASSQSRSHSSERSRSTHAFCRGTPGLTEPSPRSLHSADYTDPGGARPCRSSRLPNHCKEDRSRTRAAKLGKSDLGLQVNQNRTQLI
jgi:hypothetical protein